MARIAVIDLLFHWPPLGGSRVDLKEVFERVGQHHTVRLFVPDFQEIYPRGRIEGDLPFEVTKVPFSTWSFNAATVARRFREVIAAFRPDHLFVGDGWFIKFSLVRALARFRPILRLYAYEGLCLRCPGTMFHGGVCALSTLHHFGRCLPCAARWFPRRLNAATHELIMGGGFLPGHARTVRNALRAARGVIVYNGFAASHVRAFNEDVRVVPSGVDVSRFRPRTRRGTDVPAILLPGQADSATKGYAVLLDAARRLARRGHKFELHVTSRDRGLPIDPFVRNLGWVKPEDMPGLYNSADICVVPSVWAEPFGMVAVEAMACARPVVAANHGGLAHIVAEGRTGFLVQPGDPEALAAKLEVLLTDRALRETMGREARRRALREYDWDRIVERHYLPLFAEK